MCYLKSFSSRLLLFFVVSLFCLGANARADTAKKGPFVDPLYMIDNKESTKEQVDNLDKRTIKSVDVWKGEQAISKFGEKGKNGVVVITTGSTTPMSTTLDSSKKLPNDYNVVFTKVEQPATFPGAEDGWKKYLQTNLQYPEAAKINKTQGTVRVQVVVNADGNITEVRALDDPGDGLAKEAMRLLKKGPRWVPAQQNGYKVTYRFVVPVEFKL